jgi:hypothetical protein
MQKNKKSDKKSASFQKMMVIQGVSMSVDEPFTLGQAMLLPIWIT